MANHHASAELRAANRYAKALFAEAQKEVNTLAWVQYNLETLRHYVKENPSFLEWMTLPQVSPDEKKRFILEHLSDNTCWLTSRFLLLILENKRFTLLPVIIDQFLVLVRSSQGIAQVTVRSVIPLTEEQQSRLSAVLADKFSLTSVEIRQEQDNSLIAGLVIEMGDTRLDLSLAQQLQQLQSSLMRTSG